MVGVHRLGHVVRWPRPRGSLPVAVHRLRGHRDDRQVGVLGPRRIAAIASLPSMPGIITSISTASIVRRPLERGQRGVAVVGVADLHAVQLQRAGQREDVADVVVDDQHPPARQRLVGVADRGLGAAGRRRSSRRARPVRRRRPAAPARRAACGRCRVNVEPWPTADSRVDLAAEQVGDLPADRQARARSAVPPAGGAVGLLERLEDDLAACRPGCRCRCPTTGNATTARRPAQASGSGTRLRSAGATDQPDLAGLGELHRVGQQVAQDLLQPPLVGVQRRAAGPVSTSTVKPRPLSAVSGRTHVLDVVEQAGQRDVAPARTSILPASTLDRSRMSLISCSRSLPAPWIVAANSTCSAVRLPVGLSASSRARMSRLFSGVRSSWRHVGEELGLVPGGQRELLGPVGQRPAGLLDLAVLHLDGSVLLGQQRSLLLQLGVGALQLARSAPAARRSAGWDWVEQLLGPGVGDDRVDRDPDGLGDLVEEGQVHRR